MNFDTDDLMSDICEILSKDFTKRGYDAFRELYKREMMKDDTEVIDEYVQDKIEDLMKRLDAILVDSLMDLEFDIDEMSEMEEFYKDLDIEDDLDQRTNTFGLPVKPKEEPKIEEESELDWNEAE